VLNLSDSVEELSAVRMFHGRSICIYIYLCYKKGAWKGIFLNGVLRPVNSATPNSGSVSPSELDLDGLAGGLQRLEVELDADGDFLANQVFGYSP
jgi:hypothetical protein